MKLSYILGAVATVGLGTAIAIPQFTRAEKQKASNLWCLSQYKAALNAAIELPPVHDDNDVVYKTLYGGRGEGCSANNGTITWNPSNNSLSLYKK